MSWNPIVVGVDGSPESVRAAVLGTMIAQRARTTCTLVYAVPDYQRILDAYGMVPQALETAKDMQERDRAVLTASLQGFVPVATLDGLEVRSGRPAIVLREAARRLNAGLVIVGSRQHHGFGRLRGSLVAHLLRTCDAPVLVASGGSPVIQRVLAALDLSYASEVTLGAARQWARLFGAHLRVMHVIEPMPVLPHATIEISEEYYRADERLRETGLWSQIEEREAEKVVRAGYPATVIANEAAEWRADLLVVGSHGKGWSERLLVGSTAEQLMHHPPAPTLVVPVGRPADEQRPLHVGRLPWEEPAPTAALSASR